jgi:hypothetical protein
MTSLSGGKYTLPENKRTTLLYLSQLHLDQEARAGKFLPGAPYFSEIVRRDAPQAVYVDLDLTLAPHRLPDGTRRLAFLDLLAPLGPSPSSPHLLDEIVQAVKAHCCQQQPLSFAAVVSSTSGRAWSRPKKTAVPCPASSPKTLVDASSPTDPWAGVAPSALAARSGFHIVFPNLILPSGAEQTAIRKAVILHLTKRVTAPRGTAWEDIVDLAVKGKRVLGSDKIHRVRHAGCRDKYHSYANSPACTCWWSRAGRPSVLVGRTDETGAVVAAGGSLPMFREVAAQTFVHHPTRARRLRPYRALAVPSNATLQLHQAPASTSLPGAATSLPTPSTTSCSASSSAFALTTTTPRLLPSWREKRSRPRGPLAQEPTAKKPRYASTGAFLRDWSRVLSVVEALAFPLCSDQLAGRHDPPAGPGGSTRVSNNPLRWDTQAVTPKKTSSLRARLAAALGSPGHGAARLEGVKVVRLPVGSSGLEIKGYIAGAPPCPFLVRKRAKDVCHASNRLSFWVCVNFSSGQCYAKVRCTSSKCSDLVETASLSPTTQRGLQEAAAEFESKEMETR